MKQLIEIEKVTYKIHSSVKSESKEMPKLAEHLRNKGIKERLFMTRKNGAVLYCTDILKDGTVGKPVKI